MEDTNLCNNYKNIQDNIHGIIPITQLACHFIDHPFFQRLREIKQLATCYIIYPNAVHTRFEHSLGTYKITSDFLTKIKQINYDFNTYIRTIPELQNYINRKYGDKQIDKLDEYICELIKLAGLMHDVGHGAFSHIFDDVFIPIVGKYKQSNSTHEERSGIIIEYIIKNNKILSNIIQPDEIQFVKNLINPKEDIHNSWIYQIISNSFNSLDVDKYDYLTRDTNTLGIQKGFNYKRLIELMTIIDNKIVFQKQVLDDIYDLFDKRHKMHKLVYSHKGVISAQYIIIELFLALDPILDIKNSIDNIEEFCKITDNYILEAPKILDKFRNKLNLTEEQNNSLDKALYLLNKLNNHNLYVYVNSHISSEKIDMTDFIDFSDENNDKDNIIIFQTKIGFVSGNKKNPLDNIYVYSTKDNIPRAYKQIKSGITTMMPINHQEYLTIIFYKNKDIDRINKIKKNFDDFINIIKSKN